MDEKKLLKEISLLRKEVEKVKKALAKEKEEKEEYLSISKAGAYLSLPSFKNIYKKMPIVHYSIGDNVRFKKSDLDKYIESRKVLPRQDIQSISANYCC